MATSDENQVTVRITAIDELSPVLRNIEEDFGTLLETRYDWRPAFSAFIGSFVGSALIILMSGVR